ncbi:MAG: aminotransferase class V-fold PLP-dependent enzyme [Rhodobacter sp.]|nr:aminotransferase class V-fold PLP-dependent enzyme [Rhodobacter sp.]
MSDGTHRLSDFGLDPTLIHANHGSYGAVPLVIRTTQHRIQAELDANPTGFFRDRYPELIRAAASRVAGFLGGDPEDWVFVDNATAGVNTVLACTRLHPGDEVLTTDQAYGAVKKVIAHHCSRNDARSVAVKLKLPITSPSDVFEAVVAAATTKAKLVVLDHVSSPCGIVFPVAELCSYFGQRGIPVLVDGAHGPGNVEVDTASIGADFYTGNAHKWLCAPPGAAMLWCRRERQRQLKPLILSHGHGAGFTQAFDWPGTRDPSAWLSIPAAIDFHLENGGAQLRERNRKTALDAAQRLSDECDYVPVAPSDLQSSMIALRLLSDRELTPVECAALQHRLQAEEDVVVAITSVGGSTWLRLSAGLYTDANDLTEAGRRVWKAIQPTNS